MRSGGRFGALLLALAAMSGALDLSAAPCQSRSPARLDVLVPGEVLSVPLKPSLPLTPPPGVQQKAALAGWSARLCREAGASMSEVRRLCYDTRLLRIRATPRLGYAFDWLTPPWMAPGDYDIEVKGPGYESLVAQAVRVEVASEAAGLSELLVPAEVVAVVLEIDGRPLAPLEVTWAGQPTVEQPGPRLLRYAPAASGQKVTWRAVEPSPCALRIEWPQQTDVPLDTHDELRAMAPSAVAVVFDLGRSRWARGDRARHLWLVSDEPFVEAWSLDARAHGCAASLTGSLRRPLVRGISCQATALSGRRAPCLFEVLTTPGLVGSWIGTDRATPPRAH